MRQFCFDIKDIIFMLSMNNSMLSKGWQGLRIIGLFFRNLMVVTCEWTIRYSCFKILQCMRRVPPASVSKHP